VFLQKIAVRSRVGWYRGRLSVEASRTSPTVHRGRLWLLAPGFFAAGLAAAASGASERSHEPSATRVLGLFAEEAEAGVRIRVRTDGALHSADVFTLRSPPRLVIDLFGLHETETPSRVPVGGAQILQMRLGRHPDKIRIVIDAGAAPRPFEPLTTEMRPDGVVVSIGFAQGEEGGLESLERIPVHPAAAAAPISAQPSEAEAPLASRDVRLELEATHRSLDRGLPREMRPSRSWGSRSGEEAQGLARLEDWESNTVAQNRIRLGLFEDRVRLTTRHGRSQFDADAAGLAPAAISGGDPGSLDRMIGRSGAVGEAFSQRLDVSLWRSGPARIDGFGSYQHVDPLFESSENGKPDPFGKPGRRVLETGGAIQAGSFGLALSRISVQADAGNPRVDDRPDERSYRALLTASLDPLSAWLSASQGRVDPQGSRREGAATRDLSFGLAWNGVASSATLSVWRSTYESSGAGLDWAGSGADLGGGIDRERWGLYAGLGAQRDRSDQADYHSVESSLAGFVSLSLRPKGLPRLATTLSATRYQGDYGAWAEPLRTESLGFQIGVDLSDHLFPLAGLRPHLTAGYRAVWSRSRDDVTDEELVLDHGPMLRFGIDF
jgi:hypothetical protein